MNIFNKVTGNNPFRYWNLSIDRQLFWQPSLLTPLSLLMKWLNNTVKSVLSPAVDVSSEGPDISTWGTPCVRLYLIHFFSVSNITSYPEMHLFISDCTVIGKWMVLNALVISLLFPHNILTEKLAAGWNSKQCCNIAGSESPPLSHW